jgi:uncharacterized coiled-coil protein SlyX
MVHTAIRIKVAHVALPLKINLWNTGLFVCSYQRFVATTSLAMSPPLTGLIHPDDYDLQAAVHTMMDASIPQNTRRADASLETVLPCLYQYHRSCLASLKNIEATLKQQTATLNQMSQAIRDHRQDIHQLTDVVRQWVERDKASREQTTRCVAGVITALLPNSTTGSTGTTNPDVDLLAGLTRGTGYGGTTSTNSHTISNLQQPHSEPHPDNAVTSAAGTQILPLQSHERHPVPAVFVMTTKHRDLNSLYNEWFGLDEFDDGEGGVHGRNQTGGAKWRKHIDVTHYSRTKRIVQAIQKLAKDGGMTDQDAIRQLQPLFEESNASLYTMTGNLVKLGYLKQGKPRKRRANEIHDV